MMTLLNSFGGRVYAFARNLGKRETSLMRHAAQHSSDHIEETGKSKEIIIKPCDNEKRNLACGRIE